MPELILPQELSLALRAQAHRLDPVVRMGAAGLSEAVLREIDRALQAHGLVKVRGGRLERAELDALFHTMAERLGAARVQVIGHTFVLYRPPAEPAAKPATGASSKPPSPAKPAARARPAPAAKAGARPAAARPAARPPRRPPAPAPRGRGAGRPR